MKTQGMNNNMFVFDCVVHAYDNSDNNLRDDVRDSKLARAIGNFTWVREALHGPDDEWRTERALHRWTPDELYDMEFGGTSVDMAMAQTVPVFDWYRDGLAPVAANYAFASKYPDKVIFCGGVDPGFHGAGVLDEMTRQKEEWGARAFKFYNAHAHGKTWACDDEKVAYPMYEHARGLGIDVVQFHKGMQLGTSNIEDLRPNDIQRAAVDFPDMKFVLYHLGVPYFEETLSIAARFPNVYLALSGNVALGIVRPRVFYKQLGFLLSEVGSDRLFFGSETPILGSPEAQIQFIRDLEMPEQLQEDYGFPDITDLDKRKILGESFARLMNIPVPAESVTT